MKHLYLLLFVFLTAFMQAPAQTTTPAASDYYFSTASGVQLEDMSEAIELLGTGMDEQYSAVTDLPIDFFFGGNEYLQFAVNPNGILEFRPAVAANGVPQFIFPWAEDLSTMEDGYVKYKVIGTTNRKLVVEWFVGEFVGAGVGNADKRFQAWLYEGTNKIQFVYGNGITDEVFTQALVGISSDYLVNMKMVKTNEHTATTDPSWANSIWPGVGRSYTFSPTEEVIVDPTPDPIASIEAEGETIFCNGGSVQLTAALEYETAIGYQWLKNGEKIAGATSLDFIATESGDYAVSISHATGNITSQTVVVKVINVTASVQSTNLTCNQGDNGTITITNEAGGSGDYEFSINGSDWQTNNNFGGLAAGTYAIYIRDIANASCVFPLVNVTIEPASGTAPDVTIASTSKEGCAVVKLTANPANANYVWSNGATSQVIELTNEDADGVYTVTVSANGGCAASASYNFVKEDLLKSYTVVGLKYVLLHENNTVKGGVGNTKVNGVILVNRNSEVNGFVKGDIVAASPADVTGAIVHTPASVKLPVMRTNTAVTKYLASKNIADNFNGVVAGNYKKLVIGKRANVTITGNVFGIVEVEEGADVIFTAADISIDEVKTGDGKAGFYGNDFTTITFANNAVIRVKNKVTIGNRSQLSGEGATLFMGDQHADDERIVVNGKNTLFNVNVYMPNGILAVKGAEATRPCTMKGLFIAEVILSDRYVNWTNNLCYTSLLTRTAQATKPLAPLAPVVKTLKAYPNPANSVVNLQLDNTKATNAEVVIISQTGAVVYRQNLSNVEPGKTLQYDMSKYPAGLYTIKVMTAGAVKTLKVAVQR